MSTQETESQEGEAMTNGDRGGRDLSFIAFIAVAMLLVIGVLVFSMYGDG
jgi:hypothetical protein